MKPPLLRYREVPPPADLAPWIEAIWSIRTIADAPGLAEHWVLPEASANLVFWLPGGWRNPRSIRPPIVSGPSLHAMRKPAWPGEAYLGVRFLPGAAAGFFDCQVADLSSTIQPLHQVQHRWSAHLAERLCRCRSELAATNELIAELRCKARRLAAGDQLMLQAARWYRHSRPGITMEAWGQHHGLSVRQFRRRFLAAVGMAPKAFARIVRLQALVRRELIRPDVAWAPLAYRTGFSDQAHLAKDFRSLSGAGLAQFHRHLQSIDHLQLLPDLAGTSHGRFLQDATGSTR